VPDAYDTLGVRRDASLDEIRISYRRSVQVLQPERFASASEPIQQEAARRLSELTTAMEQIEAWRSGEASGTGALGPVPFGAAQAAPEPVVEAEAEVAPAEPAATQTAIAPEPPVEDEPLVEEPPAVEANGAAPAAPAAPGEISPLPPAEPPWPDHHDVAAKDEIAPPSVFDVDALRSADEVADPTLAASEPPIAAPPPAAAPPTWRQPPAEHVEWEAGEEPEEALADELATRRPRRKRTRLQRGVIVVGVLAVAAVPTVLYLQNRGGSGGTPSDERVFSRPGAPFTFHYPVGWKEINVRPGAALNKPTYSVELGLTQQDLIGAQTYALRFDVKPDGSAVDRASGRSIPRVELERDIDVRIEQIGRAAGMSRVDAPVKGKLGELPARIYRYRGQGATSTFYVAFQNATEYFVNCHAGSQPAQTNEACDLVTSTFTLRA
jgi:hypothetical protein